MKLFGHRGASCACPENTAAAFTNALSGDGGAHPKVTGVECDMQLLRDGTIVVLHDDTLRRTADHAVNAPHVALFDTAVNELSWDELREVDVGAWKDAKWTGERMLPVGDFFGLIAGSPGAAALVELKGGDQAMVEPAVAAAKVALKEGGLAAESIWWISFDLALVAAMKKALPQTSAWHVAHVTAEQGEAKCLELIAAAQQAGIDGVDFAALPDVITPAVFEAAETAGVGVGVWVSSGLGKANGPVDTAANCELFSERGAVFFTSDLPADVWAWWDAQGAAAASTAGSQL
jgi:glycerophosphoryl diester phosphodiesterase